MCDGEPKDAEKSPFKAGSGLNALATGTLRMFSSEKAQYPGIFYFVAGGGFENYRYLTIKDGELSSIDLWAENYGFAEEGDPERIVTYTTDKEIIAESKALYENNKDIQRQSFIPVE